MSLRYIFCGCFNPYRIHDFIQSFTETGDEEETIVFETSMINTNPFAFVGTNIPSVYGGLVIDPWRKNEKVNLLP